MSTEEDRRREARRAKILNNSRSRIDKILGVVEGESPRREPVIDGLSVAGAPGPSLQNSSNSAEIRNRKTTENGFVDKSPDKITEKATDAATESKCHAILSTAAHKSSVAVDYALRYRYIASAVTGFFIRLLLWFGYLASDQVLIPYFCAFEAFFETFRFFSMSQAYHLYGPENLLMNTIQQLIGSKSYVINLAMKFLPILFRLLDDAVLMFSGFAFAHCLSILSESK